MRKISRFLITMVCLLVALIPALAQDDDETGSLPITADVNYSVRPGDTLDTIGALFDVSPICIAQMNGFTIYDWADAGTSLLISVSCPRYAEDPAYFPTSFVPIPREVVVVEECAGVPVGSADTVEGLAHMLNVTPEALREANNLTEDTTLRMGMCLTISAPEDSTAGAGGGGGSLEGEFYVVGLRESLDEIAFKLDVSLQSILWANNIEDVDGLVPGQTIFIPADAPPYGVFPPLFPVQTDETLGQGGALIAGEEVVVQPGDTLYEIALAHNTSLQAIMLASNIEPGQDVPPGTVIIIPDDAPPYGEYPPMFTVSGEETSGVGGGGGVEGEVYVLQPLDTLDGVALAHNKSLQSIILANGIGENQVDDLHPGTVIIIPDDAPPYGEYPPMFTVTGDETSGAGGGGGPAGQTYVLQPLDTMEGIARQFNVDVRALMEANGNPNVLKLQPGTVIVIPENAPPFVEPGTIPPPTISTTDDDN